MSARIETYVYQSLAGAGFAILDPVIAATLRPDLWGGNGGIEAAWEFGRAENVINGLRGVHRFTLRLADSRDTAVVARSGSHLASRIEWILGREVKELFHESEVAGTVVADDAPPRARADTPTGDRYAGAVTAEPARSCSSCDHLTAGHACRAAKLSGVEYPAANVPRRCLQFVPLWNAMDMRKGPVLWPELVDHAD